jgi:opacity protein-like surface antigen
MKLKVVVSSLAFLFLFGVAAARADDTPKIDVFAGYSYMRGNPSRDSGLHGFNLNGAQFSVSYNLNSWLSGVAEIDGYHTSRSDVFTCTIGNCPANGITATGNLWTYLAGPRFSYRHLGRFTPFAQVLFGATHVTPSVFLTSNQTSFTTAIGEGFDFRLTRHWSIRPIEVDYLLTHFKENVSALNVNPGSQPQNNVRATTGVVFHF